MVPPVPDAPDKVEVARVFVELVSSLRSGRELVDALDVFVRACTAHTAVAEAAVVVALDATTVRAVASTQERTLDIEEAQIGADGGPCLEVLATGEPMEVADVVDVRDRWPEFVATALSSGVGAVLAIPITVDDRTIAGVNLFLRGPGRLSRQDVEFVRAMTSVVEVSLSDRDAQTASTEQLTYALESRVVIEQAKGFLAFQNDTSVGAAFQALRSYARSTRSPLREVAQGVVERTLTL
jgi:GAF domain-containing protein